MGRVSLPGVRRRAPGHRGAGALERGHRPLAAAPPGQLGGQRAGQRLAAEGVGPGEQRRVFATQLAEAGVSQQIPRRRDDEERTDRPGVFRRRELGPRLPVDDGADVLRAQRAVPRRPQAMVELAQHRAVGGEDAQANPPGARARRPDLQLDGARLAGSERETALPLDGDVDRAVGSRLHRELLGGAGADDLDRHPQGFARPQARRHVGLDEERRAGAKGPRLAGKVAVRVIGAGDDQVATRLRRELQPDRRATLRPEEHETTRGGEGAAHRLWLERLARVLDRGGAIPRPGGGGAAGRLEGGGPDLEGLGERGEGRAGQLDAAQPGQERLLAHGLPVEAARSEHTRERIEQIVTGAEAAVGTGREQLIPNNRLEEAEACPGATGLAELERDAPRRRRGPRA